MERIEIRHGGMTSSAFAMGEGPLVLCLHGFPDNARSYRHQLPALAGAGYRAVAVTLRGYEPSSLAADGDYAQGALAGDVLAVMDALGAERAHLVGHDWGAAIAYPAAAAAPDRFESVTVMAVPHSGRFLTELTLHPRQLRLSWYMFFFQLRGLADAVVRRNDYAFIRMLWRHWSPGWTPPEDEMRSVLDTLRAPGVLGAALAYYRAALSVRSMPLGRRARAEARYPVPVRTLALTGAQDGCIAADVFEALTYTEDFPAGVRVERIEGAGHFLHQERPDEINAILIDWLSGGASGRAESAPPSSGD